MRHCLALAEAVLAKGEAPVRTVLVREGRVLGEGVEATRALHAPRDADVAGAPAGGERGLGSPRAARDVVFSTSFSNEVA